MFLSRFFVAIIRVCMFFFFTIESKHFLPLGRHCQKSVEHCMCCTFVRANSGVLSVSVQVCVQLLSLSITHFFLP